MKKKITVSRNLLITTILALLLVGCGSSAKVVENDTQTEQKEETTIQNATIQEPQEEAETKVEENNIQEEVTTESQEEPAQSNTNEEIWTSVEETNDICMVVLNENAGTQEVMFSKGVGAENVVPYIAQEEDKIFIPIRDNITDILLFYCGGERDSETLYDTTSVGVDYPIVELGNGTKAIEVVDSLHKDYNIMIYIKDLDEYVYFLIGY